MFKERTAPFISIIMPNLNGGDFVIDAIGSILNLDYPGQRFEIIVVDNNSYDNSSTAIRNRYNPYGDSNKIKLIELDKNVGAPAAYNIGIENANKDYDYILKLDNDIILDKNCIMELVKCGESNKGVGIIGGKVFYFSDRKRLHLIGSRVSPFFGGGIGIGKFKLDNGQYNKNLELDAVNGCMMLLKKELIEKIGLMDENYFLYFDDLDWSLRAMKNGFKRIYCHSAIAFHNTSKPNKRFQSKVWLHYAIFNSFYFMKKNYSGFDRAIFFIALHIRMLNYICGIILNNKILKQPALFKTVFSSYCKGIRHLWKRE